MSKTFGMRLLSGTAGVIVACAALLAVTGVANAQTKTLPIVRAPHAEAQPQASQAEATGGPVSYTSEQADRGEDAFKRSCVECHGDDLRGGLLGGPPLRGVAFEGKYASGMPAGMLFEVMSGTMPPDSPGRFSESTYADLMAYILKRNGFPAGGAPLPSDVDTLYNLTIEK